MPDDFKEVGKVEFKISTESSESDGKLFGELLQDLNEIAETESDALHLEYKVKYGSIDVVVLILIPIAVNIASTFIASGISRIVNRIRGTPGIKNVKCDNAALEAMAKKRHEELGRQYNGVSEIQPFERNGMNCLRVVIRDVVGKKWPYEICRDGAFRDME